MFKTHYSYESLGRQLQTFRHPTPHLLYQVCTVHFIKLDLVISILLLSFGVTILVNVDSDMLCDNVREILLNIKYNEKKMISKDFLVFRAMSVCRVAECISIV